MEYIKILTIKNIFEEQILNDLLKENHIPFLITNHDDDPYNTIFKMNDGWAVLEAPEQYKNKIISIYNEIQEDLEKEVDIENDDNYFEIRKIDESDQNWMNDYIKEHWNSTFIVSINENHYANKLNGFVALSKEKPVGLLTYHINEYQCEIVTLNSSIERIGIGSSLIENVINEAIANNCERIWLITTNDNIKAFSFYQKKGFLIKNFYLNEVDKLREIKPNIPEISENNIPIKDIIEFEYIL